MYERVPEPRGARARAAWPLALGALVLGALAARSRGGALVTTAAALRASGSCLVRPCPQGALGGFDGSGESTTASAASSSDASSSDASSSSGRALMLALDV